MDGVGGTYGVDDVVSGIGYNIVGDRSGGKSAQVSIFESLNHSPNLGGGSFGSQ